MRKVSNRNPGVLILKPFICNCIEMTYLFYLNIEKKTPIFKSLYVSAKYNKLK